MAKDLAGLAVRKASSDDAPALAEVAASTFRETFETDNTPEDMEVYLEQSFSPEVIRAELADPANTFLVVFGGDDDVPIGYAKLRSGAAETAVQGPAPIEIERIYVRQEAIGRGVGATLLDACVIEARALGRETLWLGVWEKNPRAIEAYRRWGFREVGSHVFLLGSDRQRDVLMERPVDLSLDPAARSSGEPTS